MKKHIINIIKFVTFMTLIFFLITKVGEIFIPTGWKNDWQGYVYSAKGFYAEKSNQIDVLFLGTSSMQRSISPMHIYELEGFTSFNYNAPTARPYMYYYFLSEVLNYQKPKVVFIDTVTLFYEEKESEGLQRQSFDLMKLDLTKLKMIFDPVFENTFEDEMSYIFPLLRFHDRWNEVTFEDIKNAHNNYHSITKGFLVSDKLKANSKGYQYMEKGNRKIALMDDNKKYFDKIIDLCKKKNIDVVFLGMPDTKAWNYESSAGLEKMAEEADVKFLDLNDTNNLKYDWNKDTEDGGGHLNLYGANKTSEFLANYLKENYELKDHRDDKKYENWNADLEKYKEKEETALKKLESR